MIITITVEVKGESDLDRKELEQEIAMNFKEDNEELFYNSGLNLVALNVNIKD